MSVYCYFHGLLTFQKLSFGEIPVFLTEFVIIKRCGGNSNTNKGDEKNDYSGVNHCQLVNRGLLRKQTYNILQNNPSLLAITVSQ